MLFVISLIVSTEIQIYKTGFGFQIEKYWCPLKLSDNIKKLGWNSDWDIQPFRYFCFCDKTIFTMNKSSHFIGQPAYGQLINLLDKEEILEISRSNGGERYVKRFDAWQHLLIMLYAIIKRFDSLREITDSMFPEARKLTHLGINMMPSRSTLSDANEGVPSDVRFSSAATNDSFRLKPTNYAEGDILALDRAYIDYGKLEELTARGVIYVTKKVKDGDDIIHKARIVTYVDIKKNKPAKLVSSLTNDMKMTAEEIVSTENAGK